MSGGNNAKGHKSEEIVEEYISSLLELTINSKPLINMLTILAEDYIDHATAIVEAVELHLQKVRSEIKLPVLYLIDSIVKNVNRAYLSLFTKNIVNTFCSVFEKVDENTRASMWKLRQTWNEVFPAKKLFALDVRVHNIDPAWPITPLPPSSVSTKSIHVNPKFLSMQQQAAQQGGMGTTQQVPQVQPPVTTPPVVGQPTVQASQPVVKISPSGKPVSTSEAEMREQLLKKQKELIELQKQKIELELLQAKASLEQQRRQLDKQSTHLKPELSILPENALEKPVSAIVAPSQVLKHMEKQLPAAAVTITNKSGLKIAPANSVAVASAKAMMSRDPRLKMAMTPPENIGLTNVEDFAKQQQLMHQFKLHMQSKLSNEQSSLLNDANKGTSEPEPASVNNKSLDNKRAKDSSQKKEPITTNTTITTTTTTTTNNTNTIPQRNSNNIKDQSKSSSSKSSSTRGSSSSSKTSSSSNSSRKTSSKSRSKSSSFSSSSSSSSSSPNKIPKLEESSSQSLDKRSSSKKPKSRKTHSPSPVPVTATNNGNGNSSSYRIPRRTVTQEPSAATAASSNNSSSSGKSAFMQSGLDEEEQSGSLIVSPPHPPHHSSSGFKEIRSNARMRNYVRRNKDGSRSPEIIEEVKEIAMPDASKDEDLRSPIVSVSVVAAAAALDTKEDLDLRVLTMPANKRKSSDLLDTTNIKRSKAEKFDALFGNEDVDLRTLTNPKAGRPPTPPPPVISGDEQSKDNCWAKLKTPSKSERESTKPLSDRNRDRLGRPRLYNKLSSADDLKDRRSRGMPFSRDLDRHNERNADRNIEIIMKQAAEQLNQGTITKAQYNTLIQEVLHMSEDQKLRAAQRKEQEIGMLVWEKGVGMDGPGSGQNFGGNDENSLRKEHPAMLSRPPGQSGPRWQGPWHQPWAHPPPGPFSSGPHGFPGGPDGFRPLGPWQNHPRLFAGPLRPDFHPPFHGAFGPRMGPPPPLGPNGPLLMPNGPMKSMGAGGPMNQMSSGGGPMGSVPPLLIGNGPIRSEISIKRSPPSSGMTNSITSNSNSTTSDIKMDTSDDSLSSAKNSGQLPQADPNLLEEITKDTMKSINIDNVPREIRYYGNIGVVFMRWDDPRDIGFQDGTRRIFIDGKDSILCNFNDDYREFTYEGEIHRIKLGTPTRELYIDDKWYECYFGGRPITIDLGNKKVNIKLDGPPPQVKIGNIKRTDLVIGKINLIINARNMVPVFLDSKPQMFEIDGKSCTLEFTDSLQTVLLNGRPFKVEFGGLPKPIIIQSKKHFIRFSVLPRGFRAGYVKITGMKGEQPKESIVDNAIPEISQKTEALTTTPAAKASPSIPLDLDHDSTSLDDMMDTTLNSKPDLQLDVLSSVVPSAMAPSSGLSYQAEPVENPPAAAPTLTLPLNLNELFQRLVETGIVPNLAEPKKQEEEEKKEPEIIPVTFNKPETLKIKQPAIVTGLYSGMQCSSCGARFAPEMATRYSHHLDWHFRQNRKERDSARKAHSRPWYYDVSDWIQFEEIEDLEDRAQSWFETEKQTAEIEGASAEDVPQETQLPSVPTGSDEDSCCEVCHEAFEQFYNEEKEEWHLRPAVTYEEKNYHPLCLEDHKTALEKSAMVLEEAIAEMEEETKKEEEQKQEQEQLEKQEQDDDDVKEIEIQKDIEIDEKPVIDLELESLDDENKEIVKDECLNVIKKDEKIEDVDMDDSEPIEIIEPLPREIELEEIDDSSDDEIQNTKERTKDSLEEKTKTQDYEKKIEEKIPDDVPLIFENVKIKQEPIDETEIEESIAEAAAVDTTQVAVKSTIDGNVELDSATSTMPSAPSKIKINITKSLNVTTKESEEPKEKDKKSTEIVVEPTTAKPLIPAAIKPALQGKKLSILPTVEKGYELSGLCSIM